MKLTLSSALENLLSGWRKDIAPTWHSLFDAFDFDFSRVAPDLTLKPWEPIFPVRKTDKLLGSPEGSHIFRAFDGIEPKDVRCILLGQDPFPCPAFSTGRAFEAGNTARWRELEKITFSPSMRSFTQTICTALSSERRYSQGTQAWHITIKEIEEGKITLPAPTFLLDKWRDEGVLALNSSLTISRFSKEGDRHQLEGHSPLWHPFIMKLIAGLATASQTPLIVLSFGQTAKTLIEATRRSLPEDISENLYSFAVPHPATGDDYLSAPNAFLQANRRLAELNKKPINW